MLSFSDPEAVARYAEGPVRLVPGFHDLQRMATLLLPEPLARMLRFWFSAEMLDLARRILGPLAARRPP